MCSPNAVFNSLPIGQKDGATTILKTRVVVQRQQLCRIDREAKPAAYELDHILQEPKFLELIANADAILFSDYAKGVVNDTPAQGGAHHIATLPKQPLLIVDPKAKAPPRPARHDADDAQPRRSAANGRL